MTERGSWLLRVGGVEHDDVGVAAERGDRGRKAADEGDVGRAFQDVAAGIVAGMDQEFGLGDAAGEGARRGNAFAVGAAIGMRGRVEIGAAELFSRSPSRRWTSRSSMPAP